VEETTEKTKDPAWTKEATSNEPRQARHQPAMVGGEWRWRSLSSLGRSKAARVRLGKRARRRRSGCEMERDRGHDYILQLPNGM
jgi:hypothetical protein